MYYPIPTILQNINKWTFTCAQFSSNRLRFHQIGGFAASFFQSSPSFHRIFNFFSSRMEKNFLSKLKIGFSSLIFPSRASPAAREASPHLPSQGLRPCCAGDFIAFAFARPAALLRRRLRRLCNVGGFAASSSSFKF